MAASARSRLVTILVIAVALLGIVGITVVRAQDAPDLPPIGAERLIASTLVSLARPFSISGNVQTRIDLGLPDVPSSLGGEGGPVAMIGGTQRFRVWHSPDGLRIAHVLDVSEQELVVNQREAWWWDAADLTATRVPLGSIRTLIPGARMAADVAGGRSGPEAAMAADPLEVARAALDLLNPYAKVEVVGGTTVAGRDAYALTMTPTSARTLIGRVVVAIDAQTRLPLRLEVFPRDAETEALSVGFTSVSFDAIDPAMFTFDPPDGATVVDGLEGADGTGVTGSTGGSRVDASDERAPVVFGTGFETRVAIPIPSGLPADLQQLLPYGGPLVSAVFTRTSTGAWLLVGSVPVDTLQHDAGRLP